MPNFSMFFILSYFQLMSKFQRLFNKLNLNHSVGLQPGYNLIDFCSYHHPQTLNFKASVLAFLHTFTPFLLNNNHDSYNSKSDFVTDLFQIIMCPLHTRKIKTFRKKCIIKICQIHYNQVISPEFPFYQPKTVHIYSYEISLQS